MNGGKKSVRIAQPRVTFAPIRLNVNIPRSLRRATRAEIMVAGAPTIIGNDSTHGKDQLPGQWTLVDKTNMETRQKNWKEVTSRTIDNLSNQLRESLTEYPHPMLSERAKMKLEEMKREQKK